jgi:hypothetical protein
MRPVSNITLSFASFGPGQFGAAGLARPVWRERFGAGPFWRGAVLARIFQKFEIYQKSILALKLFEKNKITTKRQTMIEFMLFNNFEAKN